MTDPATPAAAAQASPGPRPETSLRALAVSFAAGSLLLVLATVAVGGVGLVLWQRATEASLRLTSLVEELQAVRGGLYRQMKEVFDAAFLADADAARQYRALSAQVEERLQRLRQLAGDSPERLAVARVEAAYRAVRARTDPLMAGSAGPDSGMLDAELERGSLRSLDAALDDIEGALRVQGEALAQRRDFVRRSWLLLLGLPLGVTVLALLAARLVLERAVLRPLQHLRQATVRISHGELSHPAPVAGARELADLARAINGMAGELARSRESLVRAEKQASLGELVPVLAHNIRNPLASIRATAQVLGDGHQDAELLDGLRGIIATTDRLERWTHALLSYLNPLQPQRVPLAAGTLADALVQLLGARAAARGVVLDLDGWARETILPVDPQLLEQALHGLLLNALEAAPPGTRVALSLRRSGAMVVVEIADEGPGMPFEPAVQGLAPGPSTKPRGTGLGIPFAAKVCDVHGGRLQLRGATPHGTVARLELPA